MVSELEEVRELSKNSTAEEFYSELGKINNELKHPMFANISKVGKTILSLPHSTATVEKKCSQQNLIKNPCRNKLLPKTAGNLMSCTDLLKYGNLNVT